jgi:hypothetical protein
MWKLCQTEYNTRRRLIKAVLGLASLICWAWLGTMFCFVSDILLYDQGWVRHTAHLILQRVASVSILVGTWGTVTPWTFMSCIEFNKKTIWTNMQIWIHYLINFIRKKCQWYQLLFKIFKIIHLDVNMTFAELRAAAQIPPFWPAVHTSQYRSQQSLGSNKSQEKINISFCGSEGFLIDS